MIRLWLLAAFLLAAPAAELHAASEDSDLRPRCGGPFQLCGYIEKSGEAEHIPKRFEVAQPFSEGLAAVRANGRYGYIDPTGKIVVAPRFQAAGRFTGGYAEVRLDGASGIIDRSGRLIVPARFERIIPFKNDTFVAKPLRRSEPQIAGSDVRLAGLSDPVFLSPRAAGLYHISKGWLTGQDLDFSLFDAPARGLIWAGRKSENYEEKWGLLRFDGTWQVSPRYNHVQQLVETRAVVTSMPDHSLPPQERRETIRWGAVDRNGELAVPLKFAHLSYWRGGYGYASEGKPYKSDGSARESRKGFVRANGTLLANRYFDQVDIPEDGALPRGRLSKIWYSIEPNGRLVADQIEGRPLVECAGGLSIIHHGEGVEFRKPDGTVVGRFDTGLFGKRNCPGPFSAKRDGKWYLVLEDGSILGGKNGFQDFYPSPTGNIAIRVDGMWGIIDRSGKFIVEPRFASLRPDRNGTFAVGEGESAYWINASGERVDKPAEKADPKRALTCDGGLRFFQKAGFWGLENDSRETVIEPRFRALSCFSQGVAWTAAPGGHGWCPIGPEGQRNQALECRETFYPLIVTEHSPEIFSGDPYESSVLWNRAWLDYQAGHREEPPKWISRFGNVGAYSVMPRLALGKPIGAFTMKDAARTPLVAAIILLLSAAGVFCWWKI